MAENRDLEVFSIKMGVENHMEEGRRSPRKEQRGKQLTMN